MAATRSGPALSLSRWSRRVNAWSAVHIGLTAALVVGTAAWVRGLEPLVATVEPGVRATPTSVPPTPTRVPFQTELRLQETVFIVATEAQAATLRDSIEDDCAVRLDLELRPLNDVIVVARTDEEAQALTDIFIEGNRMRVSMRQGEVRIVDLRQLQTSPAGIPAPHH